MRPRAGTLLFSAFMLLALLCADACLAAPLSDRRTTAVRTPSSEEIRILVVYYSLTGNTEKMAEAVAEGARSVPGATVMTRRVEDVTREDLLAADGIVLGSPVYYANMAGPMKSFIDDWGLRFNVYLGDKVGGAFATGGEQTGGQQHVVVSLLLAMMNNGMIIVGPVHRQGNIRFGTFGASAQTSPPDAGIGDSELGEARKLGKRVASVARRLKPGEERK